MGWLYSKWWKWLSVVLLLYVVIGSFMVPLAPGVTKAEPLTFGPDSVYTFSITGFHAHFKDAKAGNVQMWFKSGNNYYVPQSLSIISNEKLEAKFGVSSLEQDSLQKTSFDIVVNDDMDGTFALREGITFIKDTTVKAAKQDTVIIQQPVAANTKKDVHFQWGDAGSAPKTPAAPVVASTYTITINNAPNNFEHLKIAAVEVKHNKHQFLAYPYREILYESIRNTFFHVPMWFVMTLLVMFSLIFSVVYLAGGNMRYDIYAHQAIVVALLFGVCGYTTGMIWSKYTWFIGLSWPVALRNMVSQDIKLAGALISIAVYLAYLVLRGSITDEIKRARVSAVYNIFALVIFMLFIFIMPRLTDSLHPGNGGNPAFSKYDLDSSLRMFFYPASIGWILLGFWILSLRIRIELIKQKQEL